MGEARRGYSWETATEGNLIAVKHGVNSERLVSERSAAIHAELAKDCPWLMDIDAVAIDTFCKVKARYAMLSEYVEKIATEQGVEAVKPYLWSEITRAEANLMKATQDLGLDPTGRAKLIKDVGYARFLGREDPMANMGALGRKLRHLREIDPSDFPRRFDR